jgi:hypothetical protein
VAAILQPSQRYPLRRCDRGCRVVHRRVEGHSQQVGQLQGTGGCRFGQVIDSSAFHLVAVKLMAPFAAPALLVGVPTAVSTFDRWLVMGRGDSDSPS